MKPNILSVQGYEALTVVQLAMQPSNTLEFVSVGKAMKQNLIEVTEVSEGGSVNEIYVINKSRHFVFMMDGDILAGAKQNRVLNTSVFLAPESKIILPVSCVEQGRWNYTSAKFSATDYVAPSEMRAAKSVKVTRSLKTQTPFMADQREVWDSVSRYSKQWSIKSSSQNFSEVYEQRESVYEKLLKNFHSHPSANGAAFFINKECKNIDVFNRTDVFQEYFPKMMKGAALDVYGIKAEGKITDAEASYKTLDMLDQLETIEPQLHSGVGAGEEKRFDTATLAGFELTYNRQLIHLSAHSLTAKHHNE